MRLVFLFAACVLPALVAPAVARDLTAAIDPRIDGLADALRRSLAGPFTEATTRPVRIVTYRGGLETIRGDAAGGAWDVAVVTEADLAPGCAQGVFARLDWSVLGGRDRMLPQAASDCGIGAFVHGTVLAWDRDKFSAAPSWSDFWDIAKYPGKRGLFRGARGTLEIALLADGVAAGDVYGALRSTDGADRAFRKLDQLKPYVVWWTERAQAVQILGSGDVLMTSAPNEFVTAADRTGQRNFSMQWSGSLLVVDSWTVLAATQDAAGATDFLRFATDPARQAALLPLVAYGGTVRGGADKLPPELLTVSPSAPANLAGGLHVDAAFWRDNGDALDARFTDWLKR